MSHAAVVKAPASYRADVEQRQADEQKTTDDIDATVQKIREKTGADSGHAIRSARAKSHGLLFGELSVLPGLTSSLMQGLFEKAPSYPVVIRLSTTPGDTLALRKPTDVASLIG